MASFDKSVHIQPGNLPRDSKYPSDSAVQLKIKYFIMRRELKCFYGVGFVLAVLYAIAFTLQAITSFPGPLFNVDVGLVFVCLVVAVCSAQRFFGSRSRRKLI